MSIPNSCFLCPHFAFGNGGARAASPGLLFPRAGLRIPGLPSPYSCLSPHLHACAKLEKQENCLIFVLPLSFSKALSLYAIKFS